MTLAGIDVSNVNGPVNWLAWKGKISFAGIKVSEGLNFADADAKANIAGARSVGAAVIGYHFLHAADSGAAQADAFMSHCEAAALERKDLVAVDAEQGGLDGLAPADLWAVAADFAATIHGHYNAWPVVYTNLSLAVAAPSAVGLCPLWLANPSGTPVSHIGPWQVISFEQTGQSGTDADVFYGTAAQLAALGI